MRNQKYQADLGDISLRVPEAKVVAKLLLDRIGKNEFIEKIQHENIFQYSNTGRARRHGFIIRSRLESVDEEMWELIAKGDFATATQGTLIATLKRSSILYDFFRLEIIPLIEERVFDLPRYHWKRFLDGCKLRDPEMTEWSPATIKRLGTTLFSILKEAGYIDNTRKPVLNRIIVTPEIMDYLKKHQEREIQYILTWEK
jgi:hypothetical protein